MALPFLIYHALRNNEELQFNTRKKKASLLSGLRNQLGHSDDLFIRFQETLSLKIY